LPVVPRQSQQHLELGSQIGDVACGERGEPAELGRILGLQALGDLGEPGVAGDERRAAGGRGLRRDHPERLGKDRGDDADFGEREQVDEVAVLEEAGEEDALRVGPRLERLAVVAEADDHRARIHALERFEQNVDALVVEELAEVHDRVLVAIEERRQALGVALVREPLVRVSRVRAVAAALVEQLGESLVAWLRPPLVDVDAGRNLVHPVDMPDDVLEHLADVCRADEDRLRSSERLPPPRLQPGPPAHRVLELRAVRLHGVRRS
jgi:hypothetical protein